MTDDRDDDLLRELAHELPYTRPSEARREGVRSALLARAEDAKVQALHAGGGRRGRVVAAFGAGALAAAAAAIVIVRGSGDASSVVVSGDVANARVEASAAAEFEHTTRRTPAGADEVVRVHTGHLRLAIAALGDGDRVRLVTRDAEIAGAGVYEVTVTHDSMRELTVRTGGAMLKVNGGAAVFLAAGQTWRAPIETAAIEVAAPTTNAATPPTTSATPTTIAAPATANAAPPTTNIALPTAIAHASTANAPTTIAPPRSTLPPTTHPAMARTRDRVEPPMPPPSTPTIAPPATVARAESPAEQHFASGWSAFRAGDYDRAATELGAAADAVDSPLADDARYQQAVALLRAGHAVAAERAATQFLAHAEHSSLRGRAQLMLARILAARGERDRAAAQLALAAADADPEVAASARTALAALSTP